MLGLPASSPDLTQPCFSPLPLMCTVLISSVQTGARTVKVQGGSSTGLCLFREHAQQCLSLLGILGNNSFPLQISRTMRRTNEALIPSLLDTTELRKERAVPVSRSELRFTGGRGDTTWRKKYQKMYFEPPFLRLALSLFEKPSFIICTELGLCFYGYLSLGLSIH